MHVIERVSAVIRKGLVAVSGILLLGMTILTLVQVAFRYVLESPLPWAEEATRMAMVMMTFSGAAAMWASREHITITALVDALPDLLRHVAQFIVDVAVLGLAVAMTWYGVIVTQAGMNTQTISLGVPWGVAYAAVPIAFACIALFTLEFILQDVTHLRRAVTA